MGDFRHDLVPFHWTFLTFRIRFHSYGIAQYRPARLEVLKLITGAYVGNLLSVPEMHPVAAH